MTNRERAMNILHYKSADRMPAVHFGYWTELLDEWADQGKISRELAASVGDGNEADRELDKIIGWDFNWYTTKSCEIKLFPRFEAKILEVLGDGSQRVLSGNGIIERIKPGIVSIPSEDDYLLKDREAFAYMGKEHLKKHHLYVCPRDSAELNRHIKFRDHLRNNSEARMRYSAIKEEAARLYPNDIDKYIEHKSPFIQETYEKCGL